MANKIDLEDIITCGGVIDLLNLKLHWRTKTRNFPRFRKGNVDVEYFYCHTGVSILEARKICEYYNWHIDFRYISRVKFMLFITLLSQVGVSVQSILKILHQIFKCVESMKAYKTIREHGEGEGIDFCGFDIWSKNE